MTLDKFCKDGGSYMIYNLYFDTATDEIIRHTLKSRITRRSFDALVYHADQRRGHRICRAEKEDRGVVSKRRAIMTFAQATALLKRGVDPS
jgi:hypothetical protein